LTLGVVIGVSGARLLGAQPDPLKPTDLLKADVVGMEGVEILATLVEFGPRATTGKHTHPGMRSLTSLKARACPRLKVRRPS